MPVDQSDRSGVLPGEDQNKAPSPIPADHQPQPPEYLMKLLSDRDALEQEKSRIWSVRYGMNASPMTADTKPKFMQIIEWEQQDEEISRKINGLTKEINELRWIATQPTTPDLSAG